MLLAPAEKLQFCNMSACLQDAKALLSRPRLYTDCFVVNKSRCVEFALQQQAPSLKCRTESAGTLKGRATALDWP